MKNTLLLTLVFAMTLTLTWCGQQSQPNIDWFDDTIMTGTIDSGTVDTTVTTQENENTNIPPINNTTATDTPSLQSYTMAEVAKHGSETSCRSAINGNVYDLGAFISQHPGGDRNILKICGIDGSMAFEGKHGGQTRPEKTLAWFMIGTLAK